MKNDIKIKKLVYISVLSALSLVLYILGPKFPLPIFPSFLEVNFSMLPIIIGLFMMGYKEALIILLLRFLIKLPLTHTVYVGEVADLILGFVLISLFTLFMKIVKGKYRLLILYFCGVISWVIGGVISNCFALPGYIYIANYPVSVLVKFMPSWMNITMDNFYLKYFIYAVIPFNLILSSVLFLVTIPILNRLKNFFDTFSFKKK